MFRAVKMRTGMSVSVQQNPTIHGLSYLQSAVHVSGGLSTHHQ